ncbi:hypothetical protein ACLOJK_018182 [Asimina triloba]
MLERRWKEKVAALVSPCDAAGSAPAMFHGKLKSFCHHGGPPRDAATGRRKWDFVDLKSAITRFGMFLVAVYYSCWIWKGEDEDGKMVMDSISDLGVAAIGSSVKDGMLLSPDLTVPMMDCDQRLSWLLRASDVATAAAVMTENEGEWGGCRWRRQISKGKRPPKMTIPPEMAMPSETSSTMGSATAMSKMMDHCLNDDDFVGDARWWGNRALLGTTVVLLGTDRPIDGLPETLSDGSHAWLPLMVMEHHISMLRRCTKVWCTCDTHFVI